MTLIELNFLKKYALELGRDIGLNLMHWAQMEIIRHDQGSGLFLGLQLPR